MISRSVIVGGFGRQWPADGDDLRRSMGDIALHGANLIRFCVQLLGMIFICELDGLVTVTATPGRTTKEARETAAELVGKWGSGVVVVKNADCPKEEECPLQRITLGSNGVWAWSAGVGQLSFPAEVNAAEIEANGIEGLPTILRLAAALGGDGNRVAAICEATEQSWRFTLTSVGTDGSLTMESVSPGFASKIDGWLRECIGRPLKDQTAMDYGSWTRAATRAVHRCLVRENGDQGSGSRERSAETWRSRSPLHPLARAGFGGFGGFASPLMSFFASSLSCSRPRSL